MATLHEYPIGDKSDLRPLNPVGELILSKKCCTLYAFFHILISCLMAKKNQSTAKEPSQGSLEMPVINAHAAGIDVGSRFHVVAVGQTKADIAQFGVTTPDLHDLAKFLQSRQVTSVALESTAYYWIPLFWMLQSYGIDVIVVNPSDIKRFNSPKTDVKDARWLHRLHALGLLKASFQLDNFSEGLRAYSRRRRTILEERTRQLNRMHKVLTLMNVQIGTQLRDLGGMSGLAVIQSIVSGQRDPQVLLELIHHNVKTPKEQLLKALQGTWQPPYVFELKQLWATFQMLNTQVEDCDREIEQELQQYCKGKNIPPPDPNDTPSPSERKIQAAKNAPSLAIVKSIQALTGVDVLTIQGVGGTFVLDIAAELGFDLHQFPSEKHFTSWLGLAPNRKVSGGRVLGSKTPNKQNRAAVAFRQAANAIGNCKNHPLKPFFCAILKRQGRKGAITATARKLAVIYYKMVTNQEAFDYIPKQKDDEKIKKATLKKIQKSINELNISQNDLKFAA